jgi:large subunit ribosomal protein L18e
MPRPTGPTDQGLVKLIGQLKQEGYNGNKFLARLGKELSRPTRQRREVSLSNINRTAKDGETVVVPGKVLDGKIEKKVTVACWKISAGAEKRLKDVGGKIITIEELMKSGKAARIMG